MVLFFYIMNNKRSVEQSIYVKRLRINKYGYTFQLAQLSTEQGEGTCHFNLPEKQGSNSRNEFLFILIFIIYIYVINFIAQNKIHLTP